MARIERGWHTIELVPEGTIEPRFIHDDGEYPVIEEISGSKVYEGGFIDVYYHHMISPKNASTDPNCTLRRFKIINKVVIRR